jgi:sugar phosphate permease
VCSFSMGILFSPLAVSATSGVDRAESGLASGVLNTSRQVGGSLALAILATIATDITNTALHHASMASALTSGYQRVFEISAAVTLLALLVSVALPRNTGRAARP